MVHRPIATLVVQVGAGFAGSVVDMEQEHEFICERGEEEEGKD